jgi:hypothetical protein
VDGSDSMSGGCGGTSLMLSKVEIMRLWICGRQVLGEARRRQLSGRDSTVPQSS